MRESASASTSQSARPRQGFTLGFFAGIGGGSIAIRQRFLAPSGFTATTNTVFVGGEPFSQTSEARYTYEQVPGPATSGFVVPIGVRIGVMLHPRWSLVGELSGWMHAWLDAPEGPEPEIEAERSEGSGTDIWQVHVGAATQYFVVDDLWVLGGAGVSMLEYTPRYVGDLSASNESRAGPLPSFRIGAGYEIWHTRSATANRGLSLELQLVATPPGGDSAWTLAGGVGYQWY